jgi:hypothetical protein
VALPLLCKSLALTFGQLANGALNEILDEPGRPSLDFIGELH